MIYSLIEVEARCQETDKTGVIYHGSCAAWSGIVRTGYIRKLGFSYASMEEQGIVSPVVDLKVQYRESTYYPGKVTVRTWVERYSRLRSIYCYEVYNKNGELTTTGSTELIYIKAGTFKPIRLDRHFPEWHEIHSKVNQLNEEDKDTGATFGINHLQRETK